MSTTDNLAEFAEDELLAEMPPFLIRLRLVPLKDYNDHNFAYKINLVMFIQNEKKPYNTQTIFISLNR